MCFIGSNNVFGAVFLILKISSYLTHFQDSHFKGSIFRNGAELDDTLPYNNVNGKVRKLTDIGTLIEINNQINK